MSARNAASPSSFAFDLSVNVEHVLSAGVQPVQAVGLGLNQLVHRVEEGCGDVVEGYG